MLYLVCKFHVHNVQNILVTETKYLCSAILFVCGKVAVENKAGNFVILGVGQFDIGYYIIVPQGLVNKFSRGVGGI